MKKRRRKPIRRLNNAMKKRTIFACAFIALLFVILIGRLVYFSVFKNNIYKRQVLSSSVSDFPHPPRVRIPESRHSTINNVFFLIFTPLF